MIHMRVNYYQRRQKMLSILGTLLIRISRKIYLLINGAEGPDSFLVADQCANQLFFVSNIFKSFLSSVF
jgi:hypothetical protein